MSGGALYVLSEVGDDLPPALKNALAVRNQATAEGVCPRCGAEFEARQGGTLVMAHEGWCPASNDAISRMMGDRPRGSTASHSRRARRGPHRSHGSDGRQ